MILIFFTRQRHKLGERAVQKSATKFVRTTLYRQLRGLKNIHCISLAPRMLDVHLYKKKISACRYIALTASVKVRIASPKTVGNEQACVHQKLYRQQIFLTSLGLLCKEGLQLCTCIAVFLCGVRWCHRKPPNFGPHVLVNFFIVSGNYTSYVDSDAVFADCQRTGCALQTTKRFVVPSVGGVTRFGNLRRKFTKNPKIGSRLVPNTSYGYY